MYMSEETMTFCEKLNLLMKGLQASNQEIASCAGFDRTNISHFRSGKRIPDKNGSAARKLAAGFLQYAENEGKLPELKAIIGADPKFCVGSQAAEEETALSDALLNWLFEGVPDRTAERKEKKKGDTRAFGERLDQAMKLAKISNNRLAKLINVDTSLISRYRLGERMPRAGSEIVEMMGTTLWQRINANGKEKELARIMRATGQDLLWEDFYSWLFREEFLRDYVVPPGEKQLYAFEAEPLKAGEHLPDVETVLREIPSADLRQVYYGVQGIREAVLRFLSGVLECGAGEVMLFSDEGMEWMTGDAAFRIKWASLMSECVKQGVRIRIIHYIERDLGEMVEAIQSWLPLYLSGMIDPWYLNKTPDNRFTHTMFLCPGCFSVEAVHVTGLESEGFYYFLTEESSLLHLEKSFEKLVERARPLISFSNPDIPVFQKAKISVYRKAVVVTNVEEPQYSFSFTHPAMVRAFRAYTEQLQKNKSEGE